MRIFIAIEIPKGIKEYIYGIQENIRDNNVKAKFVGMPQMHLTLKFLGEVSDTDIEKIKELLKNIKFDAYKAKLDKIGVFPNESYIKVIWVGIEDNNKTMCLQQKIDSLLINLFKKEKKFHPHITLARVRFVKDKNNFIEKLNNIEIEKKGFGIKEFKVIKSTLTAQGPVYEDLDVFGLINHKP